MPGDRVCLCLPSAPVWVAALLAARRLELTAVSVGDRARPAELASLVSRFDMGLILSQKDGGIEVESRPATLRSDSGRANSDAALIHLTSGSSGMSKGVLRTEPDLAEEGRNVAAALQLTSDDVLLCATPVFHSFASGLLMACLQSGSTCLLMDHLAPATLLALAARHRATIIAGVPYVFQTLTALSSAQPVPSLRLGISGGAHLQAKTAASFERGFGAPLIQEYGLSEAGIVTLNLGGPASSVGTPIPNVDLRIVDPGDPTRGLPSGEVGEVVVKRQSPPSGYLDHPEETAATFTSQGIRSADLGWLDSEGRLTLTGRIKSMINVAGAKVAPGEVEEALLAHPSVSEAIAFSIPDPTLGETVGAVVIAAERSVSEQALRDHCRSLLSAYKVPALIQFEPNLPRTASGKPDLPRIRDQFAARRFPWMD